jgi:hypothetical protein
MISLIRRAFDPFKERQKKQEVWRCIRRISDQDTASRLQLDEDCRDNSRKTVCLPMLIQAHEGDELLTENPMLGVTKNLADDGVSVIVRQPLNELQVVCGLWNEYPLFILGQVVHSDYLGGGYWDTGIQFSELLSASQWPHLRTFAEQLNPRTPWT